MSRPEPKVYIIIVNYRNWQDVSECLGSLFRSTFRNFSVIVVDNASGNQSLEHLMDWANDRKIGFRHYSKSEWSGPAVTQTALSRLSFVQNDDNGGFAAGNNLAIRKVLAADEFIWLLNPDMVVEENTLAELVAFAQECPVRSIIGAAIRYYHKPHPVHLYGGGYVRFRSATVKLVTQPQDIDAVEYISGGSLFARSGHFMEIGLLPEDYFLYWEETDWCYQAAKKGYLMLVCMSAVCYDKISTTIGRSFLADFYYTRNGLRFIRKFAGKVRTSVYVFVLFRLIKRLISGKWRRAKGVFEGMLAFINGKSQ